MLAYGEGHPSSEEMCRESEQGETEDEEVKMNCIGGQRGVNESDFSSDEEDSDDDREESKDSHR